MKTWMLIIWLGWGHSQTFDTSLFENREQCLAAEAAVEEFVEEESSRVFKLVKCIEIYPQTQDN